MEETSDFERRVENALRRITLEFTSDLQRVGLRSTVELSTGDASEAEYTSEVRISFFDATDDLVDIIECFAYWRGQAADLDDLAQGVREDITDVLSRFS